MLRTLSLALMAIAISAAPVSAGGPCPGADACPIRIQMARGADTIVLTGETKQGLDCCAYVLRARAGQRLTYRIEGATLRTILTDPTGEVEGPGVQNPRPLPYTGDYVFAVHPNLMADGAFGWYRLTITIR